MTLIRRDAGILLIGDLFFLVLSLYLALALRSFSFPEHAYFLEHLIPFLPVFLLSLAVFFIAGLYEHQTLPVRRIIGARIIGAQVATTLIAAVLFFVLPLDIAPKTVLLIYMGVSVILAVVWRLVITFNTSNRGLRDDALIVGRGPAIAEIIREVNNNSRYGFIFAEHIDPSTEENVAKRIQATIAGGTRIVVLDTRDEVVRAALPKLFDAAVANVTLAEFVQFYTSVFDRVPLGNVDDAWLLEYLPRKHRIYDLSKRAFDVVLALLGCLLALPFVTVATLVLMLAGGTPFISHERIGKGGRPFKILKLRTMLLNDHGDPELRKKNRITFVGRFLRKTRIDELPQLINILKGELSFIGPRPELPSIAAVYENEIPYYQLRHLIPPGLSGWAQLKHADAPRGGADVERTRQKLSYDLYYLAHRSFGLDITIALKTFRSLVTFNGS